MTDRPLHILIADPHLQGGGQVRYVATLTAGLRRLGHKVTIGCRPGSVLVDHARDGASALDVFQFRGGLRPRAWWGDLVTARRFLLRHRPDVVHVNGSQDHWTFGVGNCLARHVAPLVRTRHNTYRVSANAPNRFLNRTLTDFQIVVCDVVRRTLAQHPAFVPERLRTIHNGVDTELYRPDPEARARARAEFGCSDTDVVCGMVARLTPAKGHEFLFRAAAQLRERHPQLRILVFGQGTLEKDLRRLASELDIASMTRFLGFRDDMHYCVQSFDMGAQPSVDCDTSSFSMKEQMAAGIPIIASDYGGLTEIIEDDVEGIVVPAGTVEPLAAAISRLAAGAELRKRMGEAGRTRVQRDFSEAVFVSRTLEVYKQIVAEYRPPETP